MNEHVNLLRTCRKRSESIRTKGLSLTWDQHRRNLFTVCAVGGIEEAWTWNRRLYGTLEPTGWC